MQEPPTPENEKSILPWARKLVEYLRENRPEAGPGMRLRRTRTGTILSPAPASPRQPPPPCPFGSISKSKDSPDQAVITGGSVTGGPNVHNVSPHTISTASDGTNLVWLSVSLTAVTVDDVLMPGIDSSSAPNWATGATYPSQTLPTNTSASGIAIIPIGEITIENGKATLAPTGCGSFILNHCPGNLTATRA